MKTKIILCLLLISGLLGSCKKFLEEQVDNRTLIITIPDMEKNLNFLLPHSDHHFTDLMTDDYIFRDLSGHIVATAAEQVLPIFELAITRESMPATQFLSSGFNPVMAFRRNYYKIINCWMLIERASKYKPVNDQEKRRLEIIIAKAKATKAYCNYMLASLFAKQYDPATAASDKGIPYIDKYNGEPVVGYKIVSLKEIFASVEDDLLSALSVVDDVEPEGAPFTFSKEAILGLLSRLYLDKRDWDNCIKYSNDLLRRRGTPLNVKQLRSSITDYAMYSDKYFDPANSSYLLMGGNTYQLIAYFYSGMYPYPALQLMQNAGADDDGSYVIQTSALFRDFVPQKFGKFFTTATRNFNLPLITVDEVYFNRAEATIMKNGGLTNASKADLALMIKNQTFIDDAADFYIASMEDMTGVEEPLDLLLMVKRIRFSSEGMRWFDMKRHRIPVSHVGRSGTYTIDGTSADAYVIKLPTEEITRNPDLE
ncbi:RagB/SusD family nutrient uptake outer membrane protein [Pseudoflavitalea sp. G-6-1-2]|uniref:RagB/SusD family nutrient uptake outer membrane protein n=1 Tax=Pseudoflavitalea sp. G-6-1-2 TaxID=2728841 RepID=UPI0019816E57|nr:RagB/SusD family nutrient uptake outer membrane protein [Pseudoflavitalea sp. G-6-1-2]